ncbi:VanZ family protein [Actinoplanes sp. NPDC024001]|uniref:VanZ family protein n=1 Tax=Actinoplanes sp. NPDC024001 TaxID=3154598 RepID=UPI0033E3AC92
MTPGSEITDALIAVLFFASLVPLLALPWIHHQYRRFGRLRGWSAVLAALEVLYLCGLVAYTLFPLPSDIVEVCARHNLNPLNDLAASRSAILQVALNVLLFMPLGYLLRYRFRRTLLVSTAIGLAVSLLIETTQGTAIFGIYPCPYRVADTGDLITNTFGTVAGWLLAAATARLLPAPEPVPLTHPDPAGLPRRAFAVLADFLIAYLFSTAVLVVLLLAGLQAGPMRFVVSVLVYAVSTLAVPLYRADHATLGQATFYLTLSSPSPARAVWLRYLLWWLPVSILQNTGYTSLVLLAAIILGLSARLRQDRRTLLDRAAGSSTISRCVQTAARVP